MTASTGWQLERESAERYQSVLTPTILGPFAKALVEFAALQPNETVVDVGCGTGAAARYAAEAMGFSGHVVGVDVNASMIDVARSLPGLDGLRVEWRVADAAELPFDDQSVDVVLCAQTLQFLANKQMGLAEMKRVIRATGRVTLSLWSRIQDNPYFYTLVEAITRHIGVETSAGLQAAFALSNTDEVHRLLEQAGFGQVHLTVARLDLQLPKLAGFVPRHICATPMAAGFAAAPALVQRRIIQDVTEQLRSFERNGHTHIPFSSHMIVVRK